MKDKQLQDLPEIQELKKQEGEENKEEEKVEFKEETDLQKVLTQAINGQDVVAKDLIKYLGVDVNDSSAKDKQIAAISEQRKQKIHS
jgi:hypothetical protein